jgi:hypothetical protein
MASPSQDSPNIEGTPTTSDSPHIEYESYLHPEIPYVIPHEKSMDLGVLPKHILIKSKHFH